MKDFKKTLNTNLLKRVYEDLKIAFIHKESLTINKDEIEAILDILDEIEEVNK
jgi:hypothetical protein